MINEMALGYQELLVVLVILLLLFGSTRLPQVAKGLGKSIREFKKGVGEGDDTEEIDAPARRESLRASSNSVEQDQLTPNKITTDRTL